MRDPREVLEELTWLLEELRDRPANQVILVEGLKDRAALTVLGVGGEVWQVQGPNSIFSTAERLAKENKEAVILTDWDRKGGQLAHLLRSSMNANGIRFDENIRMKLVILVKKDIKDIESLPAFYSRLVGLSQNPVIIEKFNKLKKIADREDN
jgi:5S rRNA maturation endonuclease (ribonuclease M5)